MQYPSISTTNSFNFCVPGSDLVVCAKRYTPHHRSLNGVTLVFAHCTGGYKEQWELVISDLLKNQDKWPAHGRVREAISFDLQSHGDAFVANAAKLVDVGEGGVKLNVWADAISYYISENLQGHRLVGVGHSAGATAIALSTHSASTYKAMVLVEPSVLSPETYDKIRPALDAHIQTMMKSTLARKASWNSKKAALEYFKKRPYWSNWDERALLLHVEYALMQDISGVFTLKTPPFLEAASFWSYEEQFAGMQHLRKISPMIPVHVVMGDRCDIVPKSVQAGITGPSSGCLFASIVRIQDAGHMVVQERPFEVSKAIAEALHSLRPFPEPRL